MRSSRLPNVILFVADHHPDCRATRELFERLQTEQPGVYPDGQLRTLQRRLKEWRGAMAHKMVFGAEAVGETPELASASSNN